MSSISIDTTQNVAITYELAGVLERIGAYIIDAIIMGAFMVTFMIVASVLRAAGNVDGGASESLMIAIFGAIVLTFLYPLIAEATMNGQTLGKRAVGIRVVRQDGSAATFANFVIRYLLGILENGITTGAISVCSIMITKNRQRVGDLAAGTVVVKVVKRASLQLSQLQTTADGSHTIVFEEVGALSENDIAIIREVLRATRNSSYSVEVRTNMLYKAKERIEALLHISSGLSAEKFLIQVLEDHSALHGAPTSDIAHRQKD
ncbi:MAG: RDD family protein [Bacteroidetes bacterium]|nr:RDD family protein [Bacteroidota bacterium]